MKRNFTPSHIIRKQFLVNPGETSLRTGVTLIEVAVCTILVGTLLVASLQTVGSVFRFRGETTDEQRGIRLAEELINRIELLPYHDPDGSNGFGREFNETYFNLTFDDIDDYHGFTESPPTDENGIALPGFAAWRWSVQISRIDPSDLSSTPYDLGALLISVSVEKNAEIVAELESIQIDVPLMELD